MAVYIHQLSGWPRFHWDAASVLGSLSAVRFRQGRLLGRMQGWGFELRTEAQLNIITQDVLKTSEIEGEFLPGNEVRSSVARRLGVPVAGLVPSRRQVDGVVDMMLDASQHFRQPLTAARLFAWHQSIFADTVASADFLVGRWRENAVTDPMQVVSGPLHRQIVHFEAPPSAAVPAEMDRFLAWYNSNTDTDPLLKAAIAHFWFVTIHPFDDGNGRIARALSDLLLCRADETSQRFYSMSSQIQKERAEYYRQLEAAQKGSLDITEWLLWFLNCLNSALASTERTLGVVLTKARFWEAHASTIFNQRQHAIVNRLLDGFEGKLTSSKWAKLAKCSPDTALRDIQDLLAKAVLQKEAGGGRSTSYALVMPAKSS